MRARAFWVVAPGRGAIREHPLPSPGPGEVRVETLASGVSRGTESLVFHGRVPAELADTMRCPFQEGAFPAPVKYGYASVGTCGGRRVFCLHPHQDRYVVPAGAVLPVPDAVPTLRALLAANMETALNAAWDGGLGPGDRVAVVGAGVVGSLFARLAARVPGTRVLLVDVLPERAALAAALGVAFATPDEARGDHDLVVHASGTPGGLACALGLAGFEACVLELSWYGDRPVPAPLGGAYHPRRLELRSSQVGAVAPSRRPRWTHRERLACALELLDDPVLDRLLEPPCPFAELPGRLPAHLGRPGGLLLPVTYGREGSASRSR